ncbi:MAG: sulfatase-like hydrolase/transferase [Planctomycetota bacterium]
MSEQPNFVVMFLDDSGWGDFRPFCDTDYPTPNVERLGSRGCCYHQFYVPQAICSASRASLLTGCYPGRHKIRGALPPRARGLDPAFPTMGEVLQKAGYTTASFGKWHIGDEPDTRPPARGFDESSGLMYSNDMWKHHPETRHFDKFDLQFWDNGEIAIDDVGPKQQEMLTTWYTEYAVDFIQRHAGNREPFFLYVPHNMPHVPLYCSDKFRGQSGSGLYGDVMMEIDWSLGQVLDALEAEGVDDNTVVMFTSDNGPWLSYGNHSGYTPYREGKATSFDGGTRSACVMSYPGEIPACTVSEDIFCSVDILPTFARLAGLSDLDFPIDGSDVWDVIRGDEGAENPHEYYPFSTGRTFEGVISADGRWKLHLPHSYRTLAEVGHDGQPGRYEEDFIDLSLFDMENDPYETTSVADRHPEVLERLKRLAGEHKDKWYSG